MHWYNKTRLNHADSSKKKLTTFRSIAQLIICPLRAARGMTRSCVRNVAVTEPPKIILYYRLRLSTWPLSDNKELLSHCRQVKPGKSLTTGSRYALSPHEGGTRVQHYLTQKVHKFNIITNQFKQRKVN
jgi:hypothetical protein